MFLCVEEPEPSVAAPVKKTKKSWFGLRKRKQVVVEEEPESKLEPEPVGKLLLALYYITCITYLFFDIFVEIATSRSERAYNISYAIYYRSVVKLHSLQQQVFVSLQRLRTSLNLVSFMILTDSYIIFSNYLFLTSSSMLRAFLLGLTSKGRVLPRHSQMLRPRFVIICPRNAEPKSSNLPTAGSLMVKRVRTSTG